MGSCTLLLFGLLLISPTINCSPAAPPEKSSDSPPSSTASPAGAGAGADKGTTAKPSTSTGKETVVKGRDGKALDSPPYDHGDKAKNDTTAAGHAEPEPEAEPTKANHTMPAMGDGHGKMNMSMNGTEPQKSEKLQAAGVAGGGTPAGTGNSTDAASSGLTHYQISHMIMLLNTLFMFLSMVVI